MRLARPASTPAGLPLAAALLAGCLGGGSEPTDTTTRAIHQSCATRTEVRGIDVSQWQGAIQWPRLPGAGVRFAIIRLSNNRSLDTRFDENWAGARAAGVLRGAYHYFNPTTDAAGQANFFVDHLLARGFGDGDLPPMLDVEFTNVDSNGDGTNDRPSVGPAAYQAAIRAWVGVIRARLDREPIIYTGGYYWDGFVQSTEWAANPLFHAEYPNYSTRRSWGDPVPNGGCARYVPNAWQRFTFWQYAGDNTLASSLGGAGTFGSSAVDMDVFDGTLEDLRALARATPRLDAGAPADVPAARDVPVAPDAPAARDVPVAPDAPATRDVPVAPDAPATRDVPAVDAVYAEADAGVVGDADDVGDVGASGDGGIARWEPLYGTCAARPGGARGGPWVLALAALAARRLRSPAQEKRFTSAGERRRGR